MAGLPYSLLVLFIRKFIGSGGFYFPLFNQDLTGAAGAGTAAGSVDAHSGGNSRLQKVLPLFHDNVNIVRVEVNLYFFIWLSFRHLPS